MRRNSDKELKWETEKERDKTEKKGGMRWVKGMDDKETEKERKGERQRESKERKLRRKESIQ